MHLKPTTDNAIRILQHLHKHQKLQSGVYIAKAVGISYTLFMRIAAKLKEGGILAATHGRNGGFSLKRPAAEISLYDVYACMEGDLHLSELKKESGCPMGDYIGTLQADIAKSMSAKSIAELA